MSSVGTRGNGRGGGYRGGRGNGNNHHHHHRGGRGGSSRGGGHHAAAASGGDATSRKDVKSAVCIIPPAEFFEQINAIRRLHDAAYPRWPPHINVVYPFMPAACFPDTVEPMTRALASVKPFQVTLSSFDFFKIHGKGNTVWLKPTVTSTGASGDPFQSLYNALASTYPGHASGRAFVPHMSVGQWQSEEEVKTAIASFANFKPITFTVDRVYVIARNDFDDPFSVRYTVPLSHHGEGGPICHSGAAVTATATTPSTTTTATPEHKSPSTPVVSTPSSTK